MIQSLLADLVTVLHLGFVGFVALGGWMVLRWPRLAWLHVPAFTWGALISFGGWICPLTPLENALRRAAGQEGIGESFIEHYLLPILYPGALTRELQIAMGVGVLLLNLTLYAVLLMRMRRAREPGKGGGSPG
jgi:hypothetical protein